MIIPERHTSRNAPKQPESKEVKRVCSTCKVDICKVKDRDNTFCNNWQPESKEMTGIHAIVIPYGTGYIVEVYIGEECINILARNGLKDLTKQEAEEIAKRINTDPEGRYKEGYIKGTTEMAEESKKIVERLQKRIEEISKQLHKIGENNA